MMSEDRNNASGAAPGGAQSSDQDDLRATIASAFAADARGADARGGEGAAESQTTPVTGDTGAGEPPKSAEPPPQAPPAGEPAPQEPPRQPETPGEEPPAGGEPPKAADRGEEAPKNWSQQDKDMFAALPEAAKAPVLSFYKRMEGGFTRQLQRGSYLEKEFGDVDNEVFHKQQREVLASRGITIPNLIRGWAQVERQLAGVFGEEEKQRTVAWIIHNYKIDTGGVASQLNRMRGFAPTGGTDYGTGAAGPGGQNGAPPPPNGGQNGAQNGAQNGQRSDSERIGALEAAEIERQRQAAASHEAAVNEVVQRFANERNPDGSLKYPDWPTLQHMVADMAVAEVKTNGGTLLTAADLPRLYENALWSHPSTREQQLQRRDAAATQRAADEARQRAERARKAGSSVSGAPGGPGNSQIPEEELSIRDNIVKNMTTSVQTRSGRGRI